MILSAFAENFLPFKRRVAFDVADLGLVTVRGDNRVSAALSDNGSGKTALLSVIAAGAYGVDLNGRSGDDLINRFVPRGPCEYGVVGRDPLTKVTWRVTRTRRPAACALEEKVGDAWRPVNVDWGQKEIAAWVEAHEVPWRVFRNAVVFDRLERFTRQDQAEQMRMLDAIHGVDFRAARDRARAWRDDLSARAADARSASATATAQAEEARGSVAELERVRDAFAAEKDRRVAAAESVLMADREAASVASRRADEVVRASTRGKELRALVDQVEALGEAHDLAVSARKSAEAALEMEDDREADLHRQIDRLAKAGLCATCRRPVKGANDVKVGFAEQLAEVAKRQRACTAELKRRATTESDALEAMGQALAETQDFTDVDELERECRRLEAAGSDGAAKVAAAALRDAERRLRDAEADLSRARSERWAGDVALKAARSREKELAADAEAREADAGKADRFRRVAEHCLEALGDRGLRAMLVEGVSEHLMARTAAHLEALASGEASFAISSREALKGGGQRERLSLVPTWAWGGVGQDAESGGQDVRTDLALFAALQDLAESMSSRPFAMKIFDEPEGLDARGQELFGAWVGAEAAKRNSSFLITHNQGLADACEASERWTVVLHGEGDATLERE